MTTHEVFKCQGVEVDFDSRQVYVAAVEVHLTRTEFDLLRCLVRNRRRALTRNQLVAEVWGSWFGDDHMVSVHISNLRRKLAGTEFAHQLVTLHGVGYRLDAWCESSLGSAEPMAG